MGARHTQPGTPTAEPQAQNSGFPITGWMQPEGVCVWGLMRANTNPQSVI